MPLQLREHGERAGLFLAEHTGFLEGGVGAGASRIGVDAERKCVGDRGSKVDCRAVVKDHVAVLLAELDLLLGTARFRLGHEEKRERFVDMRGDRFGRDDAALLESRGDAPFGADQRTRSRERRMRVQAVKRAQRQLMPAPKNPKAQLPAQQLPAVAAGKTTAPADVLELTDRAGLQWLLYRINGDAPDPGVIPHALWDSVPPAAPDLRLKGAARTGKVKVVQAHPQGGSWSLIVATQDPRLAQIVITTKLHNGTPRVTEISG